METNVKRLRCGECDEEKHLLYVRQNGEILTECTKCGSISEIVVTNPEIIINNISGSGTLCVF